MTSPVPNPSSRLVRAAEAERADLMRLRERVVRQYDDLAAELERVRETLAELDSRMEVLAQLASPVRPETATNETEEAVGPETPRLRGPAIRETAVRVLLERDSALEAVHYREWYRSLRHAGYEVAGKDPLAVFLTQISRSPVVRKSTASGVYEIDRHAVARIRSRLEQLQAQLRETTQTPSATADLAELRARRNELSVAIAREERDLEEAIRVLGDGHRGPVAAVG